MMCITAFWLRWFCFSLQVTDDYKRSMTVGNIPSYILLPTGVPL